MTENKFFWQVWQIFKSSINNFIDTIKGMYSQENKMDTPLYKAVHSGDFDLVQSLIDDISLDERIKKRSLMHTAAARGHAEIINLLVEQNFPFNERDEAGNTPLHLAISFNHLSVFEVLVQKCDLNATNFKGETPLLLATMKKQIQLVEKLVTNGADVNIQDNEEKTPLYIATSTNNIELVEVLLKNGAALSEANRQNKDLKLMFKPLFKAVANRNFKIIKLLMLHGIHAIDVSYCYETSLSIAVVQNNLEILKYLVDHGSISMPETEEFRIYPICRREFRNFLHSQILLELSLDCGHLEIWKYLLKCSSKIDASGNSKLHSAVREGQVATVKEIIKQEAFNFHKDSIANRLAVYVAVENGNEEILKILLNAGYSFQIFKNRSPLHVAATFNHTRLVEMLLNAGGDLNLKTDDGETLLHFAAAAGQPTMVKFLLKAGIDIKAATKYKYKSALHYALRRDNENEEYWTFTPNEYQNILNIVKMLVPKISKYLEIYDFNKYLLHINKIRVSEQKPSASSKIHEETLNCNQIHKVFEKNTKNQEFRTEILLYCLNYMNHSQIQVFLKLATEYSHCLSSDFIHTIFEYNDYKLTLNDISYLNTTDYNSYLLILWQMRSSDMFYNFHNLVIYRTEFLKEQKFKNDSLDRLKLLAAHLVLISNNSYSDDEVEFFNNLGIEWRSECEQQIENMKKIEVVSDCKITFYDVLTKPVNKLAIYVKDEHFLHKLESSYKRFSAYAEFLKLNVEIGKRRRDLIEDCMNLMFNLIERNYKIQFTTIDILKIFQYLSAADLHRLLAALMSSDEEDFQGFDYVDNDDYSDYEDYELDEVGKYDLPALNTSLYKAVHSGDLELVLSLIGDISEEERNKVPYLMHTAAARGHAKIVTLLVELNFPFNEGDEEGNTPLHLTISYNHPEVFDVLVQKSDLNAKNFKGESPLHLAVDNDHIRFAEILLANGANVNIQDESEKTPLCIATCRNNIQLVEILLKNGAGLSEANKEAKDLQLMFKPLFNAVQNNNLKMVKLLMQNGFIAIDVQYDVDTSLSCAEQQNNIKMVKCLSELRSIAMPETKEFLNSQILLQYSLCVGHLNIWKYLLKCSSKIDASGNSKLHLAVREGQVETVEEIIKQEALNFDKNSIANRLAVYVAVENGNEEILKILLNAGYSFEIFKNRSPLHVAATFNHTRLVEMLLNVGGDLNLKTDDGETLLHFAATAGQPTVVKFLLKAGIDINDATKSKWKSALQYALQRGPENEEYWTLTPFEYQTTLNIVKMLIPKIEDHKIDDLKKYLLYVSKIRVSEEKSISSSKVHEETLNCDQVDKVFGENAKNHKFRNEILLCCLNYMNNTEMKLVSETILKKSSLPSDFIHTIFEYNDYKLCLNGIFYLNRIDYRSYLIILCHSSRYSDATNSKIKNLLCNDTFKNDSFDRLQLFAARLVLISDTFYSNEVHYFFMYFQLLDWRNECEQQIKEMKKAEVGSDWKITFYDVLTKPVNKLAFYVKNDQFLQMIESSFDRFPAYAEFLKLNVEKGKRKRDLIDDCMNFMLNLIQRNYKIHFTTTDILKIFEYFSSADLHRLLAAFS
ncbi:uncharacterized protein LOC122505882 [Leptopilina heterotoma]|uniref:uncharacterized protein LOC122505882 n=1 Tax=Leptopilina heterotoma TaxID=63436 RepID=UPI001CA812C9|nr:uncharacterized protein LOC122505882 [Leptopilina heterotoma]